MVVVKNAPLGDSLAVELPALDRATLVRIQVPQPISFAKLSINLHPQNIYLIYCCIMSQKKIYLLKSRNRFYKFMRKYTMKLIPLLFTLLITQISLPAAVDESTTPESLMRRVTPAERGSFYEQLDRTSRNTRGGVAREALEPVFQIIATGSVDAITDRKSVV